METLYNHPFQVRFIATYMVITSMITWVEYHRNRYQNESIAMYHALSNEKHQLQVEIKKGTFLETELSLMAQIDGLTGVYNRRSFWDIAHKEIERAKRYHIPLSIALIDIDNFKSINDTYGHPAGDSVLKTLSSHCLKTIRGSDIFARIGGEEFAFLFLHVTPENVVDKMESLRKEIEELSMNYEHQTISCTVSIGIVSMKEQTETLETLYQKADTCLYQAKHKGRNSIYVSASSR